MTNYERGCEHDFRLRVQKASFSLIFHFRITFYFLLEPSRSLEFCPPIIKGSGMAPVKSNTGGVNHTHKLRNGAGRANHTHNLRKLAGRGTNTQQLLKPYVPKRKKPKAKAAKKVSRFLELPRELRNMIYDLAMRVDGVLAPYAARDDVHFMDACSQAPNVALRRVNRQIREEATICMLKVNTWRITVPMTRKTCFRWHFRW